MKLRLVSSLEKSITQVISSARNYEQFLYGHREILVHFFGLPDGSRIHGSIQHGMLDSNSAYHRSFFQQLNREVKLMWSSQTSVPQRNDVLPNKVFAIGAPWLYLVNLLNQDHLLFSGDLRKNFKNTSVVNSTRNRRKNILFIPEKWFSFNHMNSPSHALHRAKILRSRFPSSNITVILVQNDLLLDSIREIYERYEILVKCNGMPQVASLGGSIEYESSLRTNFLLRLFKSIKSCDLVVSDSLITPIIYALSLGKQIQVIEDMFLYSHAKKFYPGVNYELVDYEFRVRQSRKGRYSDAFHPSSFGTYSEDLVKAAKADLGFADYLSSLSEDKPIFLKYFTTRSQGQLDGLTNHTLNLEF